jgi:hypothetical protein
MSNKPTSSKTPRTRRKIRKYSPTQMTNVTYLMRNSPQKLSEQEAKLFLTKLQREYPNDTIHVTKSGKISVKAKNGTITQIGYDGNPIPEKKRPTFTELIGKSKKRFSLS